LAQGGLYASMWNRQREAEKARETLARAGDDDVAPNRTPPPLDEAAEAVARDVVAVDAAE
jgi:ATP-binding cassette, subfamily B, heavy metal transporter